MAQVVRIDQEQTNKHFTLRNPFGDAFSIDQSIAHNGVCLTVVSSDKDTYTVTAMQETLRLTNLDALKVGDYVNLERAMTLDKALDGHIVQGHVDQKATCVERRETDGSWYFRFAYHSTPEMIKRGYFCVDKGSVTINGVSLTVVDSEPGMFSVAIIPYTYKVTNFHNFRPGTVVNIEFDVFGKYVQRLLEQYLAAQK